MTFSKGDLTQPGKHNVQTLPFATGTITKGNFYTMSAGNLVALATNTTTATGVFVALETRVFEAGVVTDCQVATQGTFVVVDAGGAIQPGGYVAVETGSAEVIVGTAADLAAGYVVGRYIKHAGEEKATPAADGDTDCIVLLGAV